MGNVIKYEWGSRKKLSLDIMKGGCVLVVFCDFIKEVHDRKALR